MNELPKRIREAREALGISQAEAAQKCNVQLNTFCRWENGHITPSTESMAAIVKLLGPMPCPTCGHEDAG